MQTPVPPIQLFTPRCMLREVSEADLSQILALHNDKDTQKYAWVNGLQTLEENRKWLENMQEQYKNLLGFLAIEHKQSGAFMGLAGIRSRPDLSSQYDVAYRLLPEYRNLGYATEATAELLVYAFGKLKITHIQAQVHYENMASLRVLEKLHFKAESADLPWLLFEKKA